MTTANETVKTVLNNLNQRISSVGGVVDKWSDGNGNWWRKYADGWIEQGGKTSSSTDGTNVSVVLNTPFKSTNYAVFTNFERATETSNTYGYVNGKTTSQFYLYSFKATSYWIAFGY